MNPDSLQLKSRVRPPYQACDTGLSMWRRWCMPLTLISLGTTLPVALLLWFALGETLWCVCLFWWLKPLYERGLLHYCAHAAFAEPPPLWRCLWRNWNPWDRNLWAALSWRRLSPGRSFYLPITQLEGQRGAKRAQRIKVLAGGSYGATAGWLTLTGLHLEYIIQFGLFTALMFFFPDSEALSLWELAQSPLSNLVGYGIAVTLFAPIYICCGFSMYLNRRTALEGWDIELQFKRLAQRLRAAPLASLTLMILAGLGLATPDMAQADPVLPQPTQVQRYLEPEQTQQQIRRILSGPDFVRQQKIEVPVWEPFADGEEAEQEADPTTLTDLPAWLAQLPQLLEWLLWLAVALLLIWALIHAQRAIRLLALPRRASKARRQPELPITLLDETPAQLPDDLPAALTQLWPQQPRMALAMLLRACLSEAQQRYPVTLAAKMTEQECLQQIQQHAAAPFAVFSQQLVNVWIRAAYARRLPETTQFEQLLMQWQALTEQEAQHEG